MEKVVPIEAVLKYIKQDRDKYKAKLDQIVPYTKSLEQKVKILQRELDKYDGYPEQMREIRKENERLVKENYRLTKENEIALRELKAFRTDYRESEWFKQLSENRERLKKTNRRLKLTVYNLLQAQTKGEVYHLDADEIDACN